MAITKKTELVINRDFNTKSCRHSINGQVQVLHCHHYATLYTQLADDCGMLDGKKLLAESTEDTFYGILAGYYNEHQITDIRERIAIGEQYYSLSGLGQMRVVCVGPESAEVELPHSHVDEGWISKWGSRDKAVNFITSGYIAGFLSAVFDKNPRAYTVTETQSIVTGADSSRFEAVVS